VNFEASSFSLVVLQRVELKLRRDETATLVNRAFG